MYLRQRPKSENWASLTLRSSASVRCTEKSTGPAKLPGLWLDYNVEKQYLSAVHPVASSEWGACLTDFDRSTFRFSGSSIWTVIWIGLKSWSVRPCPDTLSTCKISSKSMHAFLSNLANRQTDSQTNIAGNRIPPPLSEVNKIPITGGSRFKHLTEVD